MGIYNDLIFTEALDLVNQILASSDMDAITDVLEQIAPKEDLAIAVLGIMVLKLKGVDVSQINGIELANTMPSFRDFVLPPGVHL